MSRRQHKGPLNPDRLVDPRSTPFALGRWRGNLPHLYKDGCSCFVTFCLLDAVPSRKRAKTGCTSEDAVLLLASRHDPVPSLGSCLMGDPHLAAIVEGSLLHFQGERYALSAWCVMPNHVHVVVTPFSGYSLSRILHSWKSFSAHEINRLLGNTGSVWEEESFDHLVRNERELERFVHYTESNPVTAGLCVRPEDWKFSSARFRDQQD